MSSYFGATAVSKPMTIAQRNVNWSRQVNQALGIVSNMQRTLDIIKSNLSNAVRGYAIDQSVIPNAVASISTQANQLLNM